MGTRAGAQFARETREAADRMMIEQNTALKAKVRRLREALEAVDAEIALGGNLKAIVDEALADEQKSGATEPSEVTVRRDRSEWDRG